MARAQADVGSAEQCEQAAIVARRAKAAVVSAGFEEDGADSGQALRQAVPEPARLVRLWP